MRFPNSHWITASPVGFRKAQQITQNKVRIIKEATNTIFASIEFSKHNLKY